jgi:acetyl-CoA carboxylase beta subunit/acetyl-CoA carboxylase alpha subunit
MAGAAGDRIGARELVRRVLDDVDRADGHVSWDSEPRPAAEPGTAYARELEVARERSGCDEAVITGEGRLRGRRLAYVVSEFRFLAGSIGVATADRIVAAVERATAEGLPLVAAPSSGGTRMQEGTIAFAQMARITAAVTRHRAAGLPYLVYLRHPTTGGVFASWGSLGHVTAAEPNALIGFLGPRVYEGMYGKPFPEGVQVAENLFAKGLIDAVVGIQDLPEVAANALDVIAAGLATAGSSAAGSSEGNPSEAGPFEASAFEASAFEGRPSGASASGASASGASPAASAAAASAAAARPVRSPASRRWPRPPFSTGGASPSARSPGRLTMELGSPPGRAGAASAWDSILISRKDGRPGVRELLRYGADAITPLSGTGEGEADPGLLLALARFGGKPCIVVGQDRRSQHRGQLLGPAGLRVARRGVALAAELGLPLVTVVDTPGAYLSVEAEEGGLAGEIARCMADLIAVPAPTVCLLMGEGTGGAALALLPADRVLAARHAWLAPLPPEGASVIVHRTPDRAAELAEAQRVRSADLLHNGLVDELVDERPDAADEPEAFCRRAADAIGRALVSLTS